MMPLGRPGINVVVNATGKRLWSTVSMIKAVNCCLMDINANGSGIASQGNVFTLIYGVSKNNCIGDRSALIRMH